MKIRYLLPLFLALLPAAILLPGCLKDKCTSNRTFVRFDPVYKTVAECRAEPVFEGPRPLKNPGKIYYRGHYLFINEFQEGIHVVDNSDPAAPRPIAFWRIPGNVDMAVKGDYLYADQYMDMLSINISNLQQPALTCRRENEFSLLGFDPYRGYLVKYDQTEIKEEVPCNQGFDNAWFRRGEAIFIDLADGLFNSQSSEGINSALASAGVSGSFARFALTGNYFYTVDHRNLRSYDVSNPACPVKLDETIAGWDIETIFPWKNYLFLGARNGVFVFNNSDPRKPVQSTTFWHATGCDPVVCDDKYAYVTVHDGTTCNGDINRLLVVGIEFLPQTAQLAALDMKRPMGLAVNNTHLFLCDDGLKVFDKTNPVALKQITHLQGVDSYDVILLDNTRLLLIGKDGFFQYDVTNPAQPVEISRILVQ